MKLKRALALLGTATALCGLAATSASAAQAPPLSGPLTSCAYVSGEAPFVPDNTRCVTINVTDGTSWNEYVAFSECMEAQVVDTQSLAVQEEGLRNCRAGASNASGTVSARRKHRHHRMRRAHGRAQIS